MLQAYRFITAFDLALVYAVLGGLFLGSCMVPVKAAHVLAASVHPLVFQSYRSVWAFLTGWLFILYRLAYGIEPYFVFTWWGVVSAAAWVPAGFCAIASIRHIGVGLAMMLNNATSSVLSFLFFWLIMDEKLREHGPASMRYYLAPVYLVLVLLGMGGLVFSQVGWKQFQTRNTVQNQNVITGLGSQRNLSVSVPCTELQSSLVPQKKQHGDSAADATRKSNFVGGVLLAILSGTTATVQYGAINIGKTLEEEHIGCNGDPSRCPIALQEEFDNFGSWMASFGIGAFLITCLLLLCLCLKQYIYGEPAPSFHVRLFCGAGSVAGLCWCLGIFFLTAAVVRGGSSVMTPATLSVNIVTSGAWALLHYREVRGYSAMFWTFAMVWTLFAMVLLSGEQG